MDGTDASSTNSLLGSVIGDAFQFATPFAQKWLGQSSTPQQVQAETLRTATLNGSGPNDPTLARQAPLTLTDFITGNRVAGGSSTANQTAFGGGRINWTMIGIIIAAIAVVFVVLKK